MNNLLQVILPALALFAFLISVYLYFFSKTLILRKKRKIVDGEPRIIYIIEVQILKIPISKINFARPFYKKAFLSEEVEDLNVVILLNGIRLYPKWILLFPFLLKNRLLLELDYREIEANLQDVKEAKVLIRSGETPIGEATIGVEIH